MRQNGFSLIELVVVIAIAGILLALGMPDFLTMIQSTKSKSAAESIVAGLRFTKAEAIRRNMPMRFQLVSSLDNTCVYDTSSVLWVVNQEENLAAERSPVGKCGIAVKLPEDGVALIAPNLNPYIAFKSDGGTFSGVTVAADNPLITFDPLGRVINNVDDTDPMTQFDTTIPTNADAKAWRVVIAQPLGSVKLCDPGLAAGLPLACS